MQAAQRTWASYIGGSVSTLIVGSMEQAISWWAPTSFSIGLPGQEGLQERQRGGLEGVGLADQQPLQVGAQLAEKARQVLCPAGQRAQRHGLEQTSRTASTMPDMGTCRTNNRHCLML